MTSASLSFGESGAYPGKWNAPGISRRYGGALRAIRPVVRIFLRSVAPKSTIPRKLDTMAGRPVQREIVASNGRLPGIAGFETTECVSRIVRGVV